MGTFPQKAVVPTGIKTRNEFDLSHDNITTSDFFRVKPSMIVECCPNEHYNLDAESLIRCYPLAVPTFGRVNHFMRWYWVPMRTIMKGWNEFIDSTPYTSVGALNPALINQVPWFSNLTICNMFLDSIKSTPIAGYYATLVTSGTADFTINDGQVVQSGRFTQAGRALMDILQNLGYNIVFSLQDTTIFSALPLLAYLRVFADYYLSPQYVNMIQSLFNVTSGDIFNQVTYLYSWFHDYLPGQSNYDPDLFVSCWDNPISPNDLSFNPNLQMNDITLPSQSPADKSKVISINQANFDNTPSVIQGDDYSYTAKSLTDYIVKSLRQITNYCMRNNIAGYKFWDRMKAEYGAVMDYKEKGTSLYIDTKVTNVKIAEVISTADTQGADLGALGGQGLGWNDGEFNTSFDSGNEWGFLVAVSSIVPVIGYYQGVAKHCMHLTVPQFFHPDFESLGVEAIQNRELFHSQFDGTTADQMHSVEPEDAVFGFAPRYYEYKVANNTLSGDFRVFSRANSGTVNSYHLMRAVGNEFDFANDYDWTLQHDQNFIQGENTQYDRIFANTNGAYDHFILIHHHKIHATRNMKQLGETIFDNEDFEHNKKVEVQYNGSQMN